MKLNQVIAISGGEKTRQEKVITSLYQKMDKSVLFEGLTRRYSPFNDEDNTEKLPDDDKLVQLTVKDAIEEVSAACESMFNIVATQDVGNCSAKADIELEDGTVVLENVPATQLVFLEKRMIDLLTFAKALPVLDPAEEWEYDDKAECYKSKNKETLKTRKTPKVLTKAEATDKFPAQTEVYNEDVPVGTWNTIKLSGAMSKTNRAEIVERILALQKAIKLAREKANLQEVEKVDFGTKVIKHIFG